jgi:hypothetical protein
MSDAKTQAIIRQARLARQLAKLFGREPYLVITEDGVISSFGRPVPEVLALALIGACNDDQTAAHLALSREGADYAAFQRRQRMI